MHFMKYRQYSVIMAYISKVYWDEVDGNEYSYQRKTFQQKRDFFQKIGKQHKTYKGLGFQTFFRNL